jgi:hypothetical protein
VDIEVAPEALSAEVDGATVILAPDMKYIRLDGTGGVIWELVQMDNSLDGVLDTLCQRYEVDRETAKRDVLAFLQDLASKGVVKLT